MREIKFRAWDVNQKQMLPRFSVGVGFTIEVNLNYDLSLEKHGYVFMQYTGLKDKNGKEIFEGDVLRHPKVGDVGPVEWDDFDAGFVWRHPKMYSATMDECEVIGNIYENPELSNGHA